jgi:hypothetical protein
MNTSSREQSQNEMAGRRALSLAPCFSWVFLVRQEAGTVSTFSTARKTVETVHRALDLLHTQLKQGANESRCSASNGWRFSRANEEPLLAEAPACSKHGASLPRREMESMNPDEKQLSRDRAG